MFSLCCRGGLGLSWQPGLVISHHADHTLSSFCQWQSGLMGKDGTRHDHAILLTGLDICSWKNEPCDTLGKTLPQSFEEHCALSGAWDVEGSPPVANPQRYLLPNPAVRTDVLPCVHFTPSISVCIYSPKVITSQGKVPRRFKNSFKKLFLSFHLPFVRTG